MNTDDQNQASSPEQEPIQNQAGGENQNQDTGRTLRENFETVRDDVQALLQATVDQGGEKIDEIRANLAKSMQALKDNFHENESMLMENAKTALKATNEYVQQHPCKSLASAALIGFAIGWCAKRKVAMHT